MTFKQPQPKHCLQLGADFRTAYGIDASLDGTGQTIGLLEYDNYLGQIVRRLREGASPEELAGWLTQITTERMGMGLQPRPEADLAAARAMRRWYDASTARYADPS